MKAFSVFWRALRATWDDLFLLVGLSVAWWAGVVLIVTAGPATAGLYRATNRIANYRRSGMDFFWEGFKRAWGRSWLLFGAAFLIFVMILFNIWFYRNMDTWVSLFSVAWLWLLLVYLMIAQYFFPLLNQQTEPDVIQAMRNAAILAFRSPLYSLIALLFQLAIVAVSLATVLPVILLMPGLVSQVGNFMATGLLEEMGLAEPPPPVSADK